MAEDKQAWIHDGEWGCDFCGQCGFTNHFSDNLMAESTDLDSTRKLWSYSNRWYRGQLTPEKKSHHAAWRFFDSMEHGLRYSAGQSDQIRFRYTMFNGGSGDSWSWDWRMGLLGVTTFCGIDDAGNIPLSSLDCFTDSFTTPAANISATSGGCNYMAGSDNAFMGSPFLGTKWQEEYGKLYLNNMNFATRAYGLRGTDFDSTMAECNYPPNDSKTQTPPTDPTKNSFAGMSAVFYDSDKIRPNLATGLFDHWVPWSPSLSSRVYPSIKINWGPTLADHDPYEYGHIPAVPIGATFWNWNQYIRFKIENRLSRNKWIKGLRYNARIYNGSGFTDILEADHYFWSDNSQPFTPSGDLTSLTGGTYKPQHVPNFRGEGRMIKPNNLCNRGFEPFEHCVIPWGITQDGLISGQTIDPALPDRRQTVSPIIYNYSGDDIIGDEVLIKTNDLRTNPPQNFKEWGASNWPDKDCVILRFEEPDESAISDV